MRHRNLLENLHCLFGHLMICIEISAWRAKPFEVQKCKLLEVDNYGLLPNPLEEICPFRVQRHRFGYRRGVMPMPGP